MARSFTVVMSSAVLILALAAQAVTAQSSSTDQCVNGCEQVHTSSSTCYADSSCFWSLVDSKCHTKCASRNRIELCAPEQLTASVNLTFTPATLLTTASSACFWDAPSGTCLPRCQTLDVAHCTNDTFCNVVAGRCVHRCNNLDSATVFPDVTSTVISTFYPYSVITSQVRAFYCPLSYLGQCAFNPTAQSCVTSCSAKYGTNLTACSLDPLCTVLDNSASCAPKCSQYNTFSTCGVNASSHCTWQSNTSSCETRCTVRSNTSCTTTSTNGQQCAVYTITTGGYPTCQQACNAFSGNFTLCRSNSWCDYVNTTGLCVTSCGYASTMTTCSQMSYCRWSSRQDACVRSCGSFDSWTCTLSATCRLTAANACVDSCDEQWFTARADASLSATATCPSSCISTAVGTCVDDCTTLSLASCNLNARCTVSTAGKCANDCYVNGQTACQSNSACEWSSTYGCYDACTGFNVTTCGLGPKSPCKWSVGRLQCMQRCELRSATSCTSSGNDCILTRNSLCQRNCTSMTYGECTVETGCAWFFPNSTAGFCGLSCAMKYGNNAATCNADSLCEFIAASGCQVACSSFTSNPTVCAANTHCEIRGSRCVAKCDLKYDATMQSSCTSAGCSWLGDQCAFPCNADVLSTSRAACETYAHCAWWPFNNTYYQCRVTCQGYLDSTTCAADTACTWGARGCVPTCSALQAPANYSATACNATRFGSVCVATSPASCVQGCEERGDVNTCNADGSCVWYERESVCRGLCSAPSEDACAAFGPRCTWFSGQNRCAPTCGDRYSTASTCEAGAAAAGLCFWNNNTKLCDTVCAALGSALCQGGLYSANCRWNPIGQVCFPTNCADHGTAISCAADSNCNWDSANTQCVTNCGNFPATVCQQYWNDVTNPSSQCHWNALNSTCDVSCATFNSTYCNTNPRCFYSGSLCRNDCFTQLAFSSTCPSSFCSLQTDSNSVTTCNPSPLCTSRSQSQCSQSNECVSANSGLSCTNVCPQYAFVTNATVGVAACNRAGTGCAGFIDTTTNAAVCLKSCAQFSTSSTCSGDINCEWTGSKCRMKCAYVNTSTLCGSQATNLINEAGHCWWNVSTKTCVTTCNFNNVQACESSGYCEWWDSSSACKPMCGYYTTAALCAANSASNCLWNTLNQTCMLACNVHYGSLARCQQGPGCFWRSSSSTCQTNCQALQPTTDCTSQTNCQIVAAPSSLSSTNSTCSDQCSYFSSSSNVTCLEPIKQCQYAATTGACARACSLWNGFASQCVASARCQYNINTGICEQICSDRYSGSATATCASDSACTSVNVSNSFSCTQACANRAVSVCTSTVGCEVVAGLCQPLCSLRLSKTACTVDSSCTWDNNVNLCHSCKTRVSSAADCIGSSVCEYYGPWRGTCVLSNDITYGSQCPETCLSGSSPVNCAVYTSNTCRRNVRCRWNALFGVCQTKCTYLSAGCSSEPTCATYPLSVAAPATVCTELCGSLSSTDCANAAYCVWADALGACEPRCSLQYFTNQTYSDSGCIAANGCQVVYPTSTTSTCTQRCDRFGQLACTGYCSWNANLQQCVTSCTYRYQTPIFYNSSGVSLASLQATTAQSSYATTCTADIDCAVDFAVVNGSYPSCVDQCAIQVTAAACGARAQCNWAGTKCLQSCSSKYGKQGTACAADSLCSWNGTLCADRCAAATTVAACNVFLNGACIWKRGRCSATCNSIVTYPSLTVDTTGRACAVIDSTCASRVNGCTELCSTLGDAATCGLRAANGCWWNSVLSICARNCTVFNGNAAVCAGDPTCEYLSVTSVCVSRCSQFNGNEAACSTSWSPVPGVPACLWLALSNRCAPNCQSRYYNYDGLSCSREPHCYSFAAYPVAATQATPCFLACGERVTQSRCNGATADSQGCSWNNVTGKCFTKCADKYKTDNASCVADVNCAWSVGRSYCMDNCNSFNTEIGCDSSFGGNGANQCDWNGVQCVPICADAYNTQSSCAADSRCRWMDANNSCTRNCGVRSNYFGCANPSWQQCLWVSPDTSLTFYIGVTDTTLTNVSVANYVRTKLSLSGIPVTTQTVITTSATFTSCGQNVYTGTLTGAYDTITGAKDFFRVFGKNPSLVTVANGWTGVSSVGLGTPSASLIAGSSASSTTGTTGAATPLSTAVLVFTMVLLALSSFF